MLSDASIDEGVFVGPSVRALLQDIRMEDQLNKVEKPAWKSFKYVTTNI
jgi:hypothetical protein